MDDKKVVEVKPNSLLHLTFDGAIVDRAANDPFKNFDFATKVSVTNKLQILCDTIGSEFEGPSDKALLNKNVQDYYNDANRCGLFWERSTNNKIIRVYHEDGRINGYDISPEGRFLFDGNCIMSRENKENIVEVNL